MESKKKYIEECLEKFNDEQINLLFLKTVEIENGLSILEKINKEFIPVPSQPAPPDFVAVYAVQPYPPISYPPNTSLKISEEEEDE